MKKGKKWVKFGVIDGNGNVFSCNTRQIARDLRKLGGYEGHRVAKFEVREIVRAGGGGA